MGNLNIADNQILYASTFTTDFSFLLAIAIGIIATFFVFRSAKRMGGGLFGRVLNYIGVGMILFVLGSLVTVFSSSLPQVWVGLAQVVLFSLGFIFLVIGSDKLLKGITSS